MDYVENGVERKEQLRRWIEAWLKRAPLSLEPASADASFRRYFRVDCGERTLIAMDAPPADRKSTRLNSSHIPLSRMPSSA